MRLKRMMVAGACAFALAGSAVGIQSHRFKVIGDGEIIRGVSIDPPGMPKECDEFRVGFYLTSPSQPHAVRIDSQPEGPNHIRCTLSFQWSADGEFVPVAVGRTFNEVPYNLGIPASDNLYAVADCRKPTIAVSPLLSPTFLGCPVVQYLDLDLQARMVNEDHRAYIMLQYGPLGGLRTRIAQFFSRAVYQTYADLDMLDLAWPKE